MTHNDPENTEPGDHDEERACLYIAGLLSTDDAAMFENEVRTSSGLQTLVRELSHAIASTAAGLQPIHPRVELKSEIMARITADSTPVPVPLPDTPINRISKIDWMPLEFPGVSIHICREDPVTKTVAAFLRILPGNSFPSHKHIGGEDCFILSGAFRDERGEHHTGEYAYSEPGSWHRNLTALPGDDCIVFVVANGGVEFETV